MTRYYIEVFLRILFFIAVFGLLCLYVYYVWTYVSTNQSDIKCHSLGFDTACDYQQSGHLIRCGNYTKEVILNDELIGLRCKVIDLTGEV